jgi:hypothetical protein
MRRIFVTIVAVMVLALVVAAPALAGTTGANGAGQDFGLHHAGMAQEMGGFTGAENPGVHHRGFSGWPMP